MWEYEPDAELAYEYAIKPEDVVHEGYKVTKR